MCLYYNYSGVHIRSLHTPCCTAWNPCHTVLSVHVCIVLTFSFVLGPSSQPPTVPHPPHPEPTPPSSTLDDERSRKLKQVSVRHLLCPLFLHCVIKCVSIDNNLNYPPVHNFNSFTYYARLTVHSLILTCSFILLHAEFTKFVVIHIFMKFDITVFSKV